MPLGAKTQSQRVRNLPWSLDPLISAQCAQLTRACAAFEPYRSRTPCRVAGTWCCTETPCSGPSTLRAPILGRAFFGSAPPAEEVGRAPVDSRCARALNVYELAFEA